jgi:cell wall-associated NlpC family hydrolase
MSDRNELIHMLAYEVAARAKVDAAALELVWRRTDERRMRAVLSALAQVGTPYRSAGNQPGGFDCSGLTSYAWSQAGVKIPRSSGDQISAVAPRTIDQLLPGDLVWHPGHIGMYLGVSDAMVHSPQTGKTVEVRKINRGVRYGSPLPAP